MRIIGGSYRGKKLKALESEATRPTLDRVKESIFNMAMPWLHEAVVLDLFGGSGGLALEAVSRGAKKAYINDNSKNAIRVISDNVRTAGCGANVEISNLDWEIMVKNALQDGLVFDIIILDPPYANDYIYKCVDECKKLLNYDGIIIVEHDEKTFFDKDVIKKKKYGKVYVTFIGEANE